ncbi:hypothetical protein BH09PSE5_BH09PSE5_19170 [soil metagenome]
MSMSALFGQLSTFGDRALDQPDPAAAPSRKRSAVFIDKNGALLQDRVDNSIAPQDLKFVPDAFEALKLLSDHGHAIVIVTSEPGLGLGLFNRAALTAVEYELARRIKDEAQVQLAGFYTCPHKPGPRGEPACLCRAPAPGLLRQAAISLRLDLESSWMVGDLLNNVEAGRRAGCRTVLTETGRETAWRLSPLRTPHFRAANLFEAATTIVAAPDASALSLEIEVAEPVVARDAGARASWWHRESGNVDDADSRARPQTEMGSSSLRIGPLQGFEPHPTREWL